MDLVSSMTTPSPIPVMTLHEVVLFPEAMLPLRIFEERYRLMLSEVLKKDRMFAVFGQRDMHPNEQNVPIEPPFEVGTIGLIRVCKKNPDGTSFVMLQGISRVRLRSIIREEPFRLLEVDTYKTIIEDKHTGFREKIYDALVQNQKLGGEVTKETLEFLQTITDEGSFVDLTAYSICQNYIRKQAMLEVQRLHVRAQMILDDLNMENLRLSMLGKFSSDKKGHDIHRN